MVQYLGKEWVLCRPRPSLMNRTYLRALYAGGGCLAVNAETGAAVEFPPETLRELGYAAKYDGSVERIHRLSVNAVVDTGASFTFEVSPGQHWTPQELAGCAGHSVLITRDGVGPVAVAIDGGGEITGATMGNFVDFIDDAFEH